MLVKAFPIDLKYSIFETGVEGKPTPVSQGTYQVA
jgi:hypothetical protein